MGRAFEGFRWVSRTDVGKRRTRNEDTVGVLPAVGLGMVSDGMGGASAGDLASQWVVGALAAAFAGGRVEPQGLRKYALAGALREANGRIRRHLREKGFKAMGATLCACLLDPARPGHASLCTLGDSRAYRFRAGRLERLTCDHTVANEFPGGAGLRPELGRLLTRAVGVAEEPLPQWTEAALAPGARLLLCSAGLTSALPDAVLEKALAQGLPPEAQADALLARALATEARDNISFVLLEVPPSLPPPVGFSEEERTEGVYLETIVGRPEA